MSAQKIRIDRVAPRELAAALKNGAITTVFPPALHRALFRESERIGKTPQQMILRLVREHCEFWGAKL